MDTIHDPICPMNGWTDHSHENAGDLMQCETCFTYRGARCQCELITRARADERKQADVVQAAESWNAGWNAGYTAFQSDAVEAVKTEWAKSRSETDDPPLLMQVIAVIKTLGGK